jgi:hypothetical protein
MSTQNDNLPTPAKLELLRLKNEQSFIIGDRAHGGPERKEEFEEIKKRIKDIQDRMAP